VISEERREITIYHEGGSYQLRDPYDLKADVIQAPPWISIGGPGG